MDENKIAEMFRDAVPDTPPASFSQDDVRVASNRQRVRRTRLAAGTTLGVVLVLGGATGGVLLSNGSSSDGVVAADSGTTSNAAQAPYDAGIPGQQHTEIAPRDGGGPAKSLPTQPPKQGGTATGNAGPGAGSTLTGCPKADGELAAALASELPSAAGNNQATPTPLRCPQGARGASLSLRDGNQPPGVVSIMLVPKGVVLPAPPPWQGSPKGTAVQTATGPKGGEIVLVSQPPEGSATAPFAGELAQAAQHIATKY